MASPDTLAAVVLAAGSGTRLRPLTAVLPKALCPVGTVALLDLALARARSVTASVAVNVHHGRGPIEAHLEGAGVHVSVEEPVALGTAGALGRLRPWIDGRPVLVVNADAWHGADLGAFARAWDGDRPRLLTVRDLELATWGDRAYAGAALLPWRLVRDLPDTPSGLWEVSWRTLRPGPVPCSTSTSRTLRSCPCRRRRCSATAYRGRDRCSSTPSRCAAAASSPAGASSCSSAPRTPSATAPRRRVTG